jgi:hypothetical protein
MWVDRKESQFGAKFSSRNCVLFTLRRALLGRVLSVTPSGAEGGMSQHSELNCHVNKHCSDIHQHNLYTSTIRTYAYASMKENVVKDNRRDKIVLLSRRKESLRLDP